VGIGIFPAPIDTEGVWAYCQFYGIWSRGDVSIEVLSALLSGPVANAYLFEYSSKRENQIRWIQQIPVPVFTEEQGELISSHVNEYVLERGRLTTQTKDSDARAKRCLEPLFQIDALVLEAYALPASMERHLLNAFGSQKRPGLPFKFPGYGAEYEEAKHKLHQEQEHRATLKRYHALVNKEFESGLSVAEAEEREELGQRIDGDDAPFFEPVIRALKNREI